MLSILRSIPSQWTFHLPDVYSHLLKLPGDTKVTETVERFKDVEYVSRGDAAGTHKAPYTATHSSSSQGYVFSSPCALL